MEKLSDYVTHEALDRTSVILDSLEYSLLQHPAIDQNKDWKSKVETAQKALLDLYQTIGSDHFQKEVDKRHKTLSDSVTSHGFIKMGKFNSSVKTK